VFDFLQGSGFLGGNGTVGADVSLVVSLLAAALFTVGWRLAARKRFEAHRWVQTGAACLNAVLVLAWMVRSFVLYILPGIPGGFGHGSYAVSTVHAVVGALGMVLGLFVALRGNELVPRSLRFSNYKLFMRWSYVLYMLGTLSGVIVYYVVYVGGWT
jgi:uncharacterized membrane protein YozB (DUF420 family)